MSEPDIDETFSFLPLRERNRIDQTFLSFLPPDVQPRYLPAPPSNDDGGGFIIEEPDPILDPTLKIPFSSISRTLESMNLTSDARVMATFRNSAVDWDGDFENVKDEGLEVSLKDFRTVCTVLIQNELGARGEDEDSDEVMDDDQDMEYTEPKNSSEPEDISENDSDEDYNNEELEIIERPAKRRRKVVDDYDSESESGNRTRITKNRQDLTEAICLDSFSLFFPEVEAEEDLRQKEITMQDLQRVCKLLGMKLKVEEVSFLPRVVHDMLSSPDR
jgi:hypothetical protein